MDGQPTTPHSLRDCPQGPTIASINDTLKRVVDALEKVAATNIRIEHVEEDNRRTRAETENLFSRMRDMEMVIGKDGKGFKLEVVQAMDEAKEQITASMATLKDAITNDIKPIQESVKGTSDFIAMLKCREAKLAAGLFLLMTVVGGVCDIVYHYDLLVKLYSLLVEHKIAA